MKNGYKYFLSIAAIAVAVGVIICLVGALCSAVSGTTLFADKTEDGNYTHTYDLTDESISRININVKDADINVIGGSDASYIELVNFNENYYSVRITDRIAEFSEYQDFLSSLKFWENDGGFKGMRYILRLKHYPPGKKVNIYLKEDSGLKNLSLSMEKGSISIENVSSETDYVIKEIIEGTVTVSNLSGASSLKLSDCDECTLNMDSVDASLIDVNSALLKFKGSDISCNTGKVNASNGKVELDCSLMSSDAEISIKTAGTLTVNGEGYSSQYKNKDTSDSAVSPVINNNPSSGKTSSDGLYIDGGNSIISVKYTLPAAKQGTQKNTAAG